MQLTKMVITMTKPSEYFPMTVAELIAIINRARRRRDPYKALETQ